MSDDRCVPSRSHAALLASLLAGATAWSVAEPASTPASGPPALRRETFRLPADFDIALAAVEPRIVHPVAIDWAADGRLWVAEAFSSSASPPGGEPLGRVSVLRDLNGDGRYEQATVFLDSIPLPTSVLAWGEGVLICAAPDILYAEDTNGDGKADVAERLFVGFGTESAHSRVNSLSLGLDNWIYGANGGGGGTIRTLARIDTAAPTVRSSDVRIVGHDFRFRAATGEFEIAAGMSVGGRARDAWGNWFGRAEDGSLWHYPLSHAYGERNPFAAQEGDVEIFAERARFTPSEASGGLSVGWEDPPGSGFPSSVFVCEPQQGRVRRFILEPDGVTFTAHEPAEESTSGFLSASDAAFEPAQTRSGPDGSLWVVDRRRPLPPGGARSEGRIYRIHPRGKTPQPIRDLAAMKPAFLAAALDTPNGADRDRIQRRFLQIESAVRQSPGAIDQLRRTAGRAGSAPARAQALCVLAGLEALTEEVVDGALSDPEPGVRVQGIRSCEPFLAGRTIDARGFTPPTPRLLTSLLQRVDDTDAKVRFQLACSLGDWADPRAGLALGRLALSAMDDPWMRAAILSSASRFPGEILEAVLNGDPTSKAATGFLAELVATAVGSGNRETLERFTAVLSAPRPATALRMSALAVFLEPHDRRGESSSTTDAALEALRGRVIQSAGWLFQQARGGVQDASRPLSARLAACGLVGHEPSNREGDLKLLADLLRQSGSSELRQAALRALLATRSPEAARWLLRDWPRLTPALRREIIGNLVAREEWAGALLDAVSQGEVATSEITPANRERLLNHPAEPIQQRAAAVLAANLPARRREVLAEFQSALSLSGTPPNGRRVFANNCSQCHQVADLGHAVGPNLASLRQRTLPELFESILDPSAALEPAFVNYQIETEDGRSLSGIVKSETDTGLTLVQGGGAEETVRLNQITEIRASNLSLMPEGLERNLSVADLADLLAFLQSSQR
jgi:putative membrane-bound dehydrogenase-like protein